MQAGAESLGSPGRASCASTIGWLVTCIQSRSCAQDSGLPGDPVLVKRPLMGGSGLTAFGNLSSIRLAVYAWETISFGPARSMGCPNEKRWSESWPVEMDLCRRVHVDYGACRLQWDMGISWIERLCIALQYRWAPFAGRSRSVSPSFSPFAVLPWLCGPCCLWIPCLSPVGSTRRARLHSTHHCRCHVGFR